MKKIFHPYMGAEMLICFTENDFFENIFLIYFNLKMAGQQKSGKIQKRAALFFINNTVKAAVYIVLNI